MTHPSPQTPANGDELGFIEQVRDAFDFLEHEYGFRQVIARSELVRYERDALFVNIICEVGLNVLFGRRARFRDGVRGLWKQLHHEWGVEFPLEYVAIAAGTEDQLDASRLVIKGRQDVEKHVPMLAEFVQKHARDLLIGDAAAYRRMARLSREHSRELTRWAAGD